MYSLGSSDGDGLGSSSAGGHWLVKVDADEEAGEGGLDLPWLMAATCVPIHKHALAIADLPPPFRA